MGNKYIWIIVVVFVVVVGFVWLRGNNVATGPGSSNSPTPPRATVSGTPTKTGAKPTPVGTPQDSVSYSALLKQYQAAGTLIQFDARCQMSPRDVTFKSGTRVMFDNRSATPTSIAFGGKKYNLLGYGFRLETLSSPTLPRNLTVDCGSQQSVGTILLQK